MRRIREVVVVEGRYDKNAIARAVDCTVVETSGFGVFSDKEKIALLRRLAEKRGLIILTDGDGAGFLIRGKLSGMLGGTVKHAYIPDVLGRERRKRAPSKEGKLGVEAMEREVIIKALERAGATFENEAAHNAARQEITKSDMYALGLAGTSNSGANRRELIRRLELPERLSANALLEVLNALYTLRELTALICNDQDNQA